MPSFLAELSSEIRKLSSEGRGIFGTALRVLISWKQYMKWALVFLAAPSPIYGCFDSCSAPMVTPFFFGFFPLSIASLFSWQVWAWHLVFLVPFVAFWKALPNYPKTPFLKAVFNIACYILYAIALFYAWQALIPPDTGITLMALKPEYLADPYGGRGYWVGY